MKKLVVLSAVLLLLLALAQVGQAATLQEGWYAQLFAVDVYGYDAQGGVQYIGGADFTAPIGTFWPFEVTKGSHPSSDHSRTVSVPSTVFGVAPGTHVDLPFEYGMASFRIAYLDVSWMTNYDPNGMLLQLVQIDNGSVLWQQNQSGTLAHSEQMAWDSTNGNLMFRVTVVPEPSGYLCILLPLSYTGLRLAIRRRVR